MRHALIRLATILALALPAQAQPPAPVGGDMSNTTTKATGSTVARKLADRAADIANVLDFSGADPSGATLSDNSVAINAAAAATVVGNSAVKRNVYLPPGVYHVKHAITIGSITQAQCLVGDGPNSVIDVDSDFDPAAPGVVVLANNQLNSSNSIPACVKNIRFVFHNPADVMTTTTAASAAMTTAIMVSSAANIHVGNTLYDFTTAAAIPGPVQGSTLIAPTVTSIAGNVLTLSAPVAAPGVGSGDSIGFNSARAQFAALGTCSTAAGGNACKYPWAIYAPFNARSAFIDNIQVDGAWNGVYVHGATFHIGLLKVGAMNVGLDIGECHNFPQLDNYVFWNFGWGPFASAIQNAFSDGTTVAANIGATDGISIHSLQSFIGIVNLTSDFSWGSIGTLMLDLAQAKLNIASAGGGWLNIDNMYSTGGPIIGDANPPLLQNADANFRTVISNSNFQTNTANHPMVSVPGGVLRLNGGYAYYGNPSTYSAMSVSGTGRLLVNDMTLAGANTSGNTYLSQSGGGILVANSNWFQNPGSGGSVAATIGADNVQNSVVGNNFNGWTFASPGTLGQYGPNATAGTQLFGGSVSVQNNVNAQSLALNGPIAMGESGGATAISNDGKATFTAMRYGASSLYGAKFVSQGSRATTYGTHGAVQKGDSIGAWRADADDGTSFTTTSAAIIAKVDLGYPISAGVVPGEMDFYTADSTGALAQRASVNANGVWHTYGHFSITAPAVTATGLSACGGGTPAISATASDGHGTVTEGTSATGCVVTFSQAYAGGVPDCVVSSWGGNTALVSVSAVTVNALTVANPSASGAKFSYVCIQ